MSKITNKTWLYDIERKYSYRKNINEYYRLDMSERTINYPTEFFSHFISSLKQEDFICYPNKYDFENLSKRISILNDVEQDTVFISTGSDLVLKSIFEIICDNKSNIVTTNPCFPMYDVYSSIFGTFVKKVNYNKSLTISAHDIQLMVDDNTKIVVLANPNSPIGDWKDEKEIRYLLDFLLQKNIFLILDEAYVDFAPYSMNYLVRDYKNLIVVKTMSKAFGAAGCRIGYCIANKDIIALLEKIRLSFPITTVSLKFALHLLNNINIVYEYVENTKLEKNKILNLLNSYEVIDSNTNWIHFNNLNNNRYESLRLKQLGISIKDRVCIPYDDRDNWIRLTIGPNTSDIIKKVIE